MKLRFAVAAILFAIVLAFANTNIAQAQWAAISSGYAVTTDWHGIDVPLGEDVMAVAGTTDGEVDEVEFKWLDPGGEERANTVVYDLFGPVETPTVPSDAPQEIIDWAENNPGINVWYANDTYEEPDVIGDWAVQTYFYDHEGGKNLRGKNSDIIAIRATSFNVVPEVPFGTIVMSLSMLGTLSAFILKKRQSMN